MKYANTKTIKLKNVDAVKPGDKCLFTGYLSVLPDISTLSKPGERTTVNQKTDGIKPNDFIRDGITGLKQTGQRDLNYKLVFMACHAQPIVNSFNSQNQEDAEEEEEEILHDAKLSSEQK